VPGEPAEAQSSHAHTAHHRNWPDTQQGETMTKTHLKRERRKWHKREKTHLNPETHDRPGPSFSYLAQSVVWRTFPTRDFGSD